MIRVNYVFRKKANMSQEDFDLYFRDTHGPFVAKFQKDLNLIRYVQSPDIKDPLGAAFREPRTGMEEPYDGQEDFWWENREALLASLESEAGQTAWMAIVESERKFIDFSRSSIWVAKEVPQINPIPENGIMARFDSNIIKISFVLRALPELGKEEGQRYWHMDHGYLARRYAGATGFLRYIQSHPMEDPLDEVLQGHRGTAEPYHGLTEVWLDRIALNQAMNTPNGEALTGFDLMFKDELKFVDFTGSTCWISKERVLVDR